MFLHFIVTLFSLPSLTRKTGGAERIGIFRLSPTGNERKKVVRTLTIIVAFVAFTLFINPVSAQDVRISDDTLFRVKGGAGLFVTGNREENNNILPDRGRKSDAGTLFGEASGYWVFSRDNQKSQWLLGATGGYLKTSDNDGVVPPDVKPRTLNYELAFGAASFGLLNREARILRADIRLDIGAAYRELITDEALFFSRFTADFELSITKPFGLYWGVSGLLMQGKSQRYRQNARADFGIQLYQDLENPNRLHFRSAKIGGYVAGEWERDQDTPILYKEEWFQVGPRAVLDFGVLVVNVEAIIPGSVRRLRERVRGVRRNSNDKNARPLGATFSIEFFL